VGKLRAGCGCDKSRQHQRCKCRSLTIVLTHGGFSTFQSALPRLLAIQHCKPCARCPLDPQPASVVGTVCGHGSRACPTQLSILRLTGCAPLHPGRAGGGSAGRHYDVGGHLARLRRRAAG
jgi:hypothetical protein